MRAGSKAAAAVVAVVAAYALTGCGSAGPPPAPPPPPDIELPEGSDAPEAPEVPDADAPEAPEAQEAREPEPEAGAGSVDDVCGLLTPAEAEEALGQPVEAEPITDGDCRYTTAGDPLTATELDVTVMQPVGGSAETWLAAVEASVLPGHSQERVDGLGDVALLVLMPDLDSSVLQVKVGSTWLTLTAFGPDGPDRYGEALKAVAPRVIQRLA